MVAEILKLLPASPPLYPPDQDTDSTERFLVAELIRERVLHHTSEEIPHAVAVQVEEFDEGRRPYLVKIRAVIFVERDSQKGQRQAGAHAQGHRRRGPGRNRGPSGSQSFPGSLGQGVEKLAQGPQGPPRLGISGLSLGAAGAGPDRANTGGRRLTLLDTD